VPRIVGWLVTSLLFGSLAPLFFNPMLRVNAMYRFAFPMWVDVGKKVALAS
jgi:hypothetical protein